MVLCMANRGACVTIIWWLMLLMCGASAREARTGYSPVGSWAATVVSEVRSAL